MKKAEQEKATQKMEKLIINTIKINEKEGGENLKRYFQKSVKNMNNSLLETYMDTIL